MKAPQTIRENARAAGAVDRDRRGKQPVMEPEVYEYMDLLSLSVWYCLKHF